jgi:hypothetical protein
MLRELRRGRWWEMEIMVRDGSMEKGNGYSQALVSEDLSW